MNGTILKNTRKRLRRLLSMESFTRTSSSSDYEISGKSTTAKFVISPESKPNLEDSTTATTLIANQRMTRSYADAQDMLAESNDDIDGDDVISGVFDDEVKTHYRKSGRRACIISELEIQPDGGVENSDESSRSASMLNLESKENCGESSASMGSNSLSLTDGSREVVCSSRETVCSNKEMICSNNSPTLSPGGYQQTSHSTDNITTEKIKGSKAKSLRRLLSSFKRSYSLEILENFLTRELKPSYFCDERLSTYRNSHWTEILESKGVPSDTVADVAAPPAADSSRTSRLSAIWELFTNECSFLIDHLMVLKHVFLDPLKKCQVEGLLMDIDPNKLFINLDELCRVSHLFCHDLINSMAAGQLGSIEVLVECLNRMIFNSGDGEIYHTYLLHYKSALSYLRSLKLQVEDFALFQQLCEKDSRCHRLSLSDLLITPMHHWTRLPLILERIRKHTTDRADIRLLDDSIQQVERSLKLVEEKMDWMRKLERMKELESSFIWPSSMADWDSGFIALIPQPLREELLSPVPNDILCDYTRELLYEGQLQQINTSTTAIVHLFLFTDLLIITQPGRKTPTVNGKSSQFRYQMIRQPLVLSSVSVYDAEHSASLYTSTTSNDSADITNGTSAHSQLNHMFILTERSLLLGHVTSAITLQADTTSNKEIWISSLKQAAARERLFNSRQSSSRLSSVGGEHSLLKNSRILMLESSCPSSKLKRIHSNYEFSRNLNTNSSSSTSSPHLTQSLYEVGRKSQRASSCDDSLPCIPRAATLPRKLSSTAQPSSIGKLKSQQIPPLTPPTEHPPTYPLHITSLTSATSPTQQTPVDAAFSLPSAQTPQNLPPPTHTSTQLSSVKPLASSPLLTQPKTTQTYSHTELAAAHELFTLPNRPQSLNCVSMESYASSNISPLEDGDNQQCDHCGDDISSEDDIVVFES